MAPAFKANYINEYESVLGGLKALGVNRIINVSFGADITTWSYISYLKEEILRLEQISTLHKKIKNKNFILFKKYIKKKLNSLLKDNETFNTIESNLENTKKKYSTEKDVINKLHEEIRKIKQLTF